MEWDEIENVIEKGEWWKFKRKAAVSREYETFLLEVSKDVGGGFRMKDFIMRRCCGRNSRDKKEGEEDVEFVLMENDFPYDLHEDIGHWIIWYLGKDNYEKEEVCISRYMEFAYEKFDPLVFEVKLWINPKEGRSILDLQHCHVFVLFNEFFLV